MTYCHAFDPGQDAVDGHPSDAVEEIASLWAALVAIDDLPVSAERKETLRQVKYQFEKEVRSAGISEADIAAAIARQLERHRDAPRHGPQAPLPELRIVQD